MVLTEKDYFDFVIFLNIYEYSKKILPLAIRKNIFLKDLLFLGYTLNVFGFSLDFSVIHQTVVRSAARMKRKIGLTVQKNPTTDQNPMQQRYEELVEELLLPLFPIKRV